jgi:hypothetical protein
MEWSMNLTIKIVLAFLFVVSMFLPDFKGCNKDYNAIDVVSNTFQMLTDNDEKPEGRLDTGNLNIDIPTRTAGDDFEIYMIIASICLFAALAFFVMHLFIRNESVLDVRPWFMISGMILFLYLIDIYIIVQKGEHFFELRFGWFFHLVLAIALVLSPRWIPAVMSRFGPEPVMDIRPPVPDDARSLLPGAPSAMEQPDLTTVLPDAHDKDQGFPPTPPPVV